MTAVKAYYDGKNFIPQGTFSAKPNQNVIITFLDENEAPKRSLKKYIGKIKAEDCEKIFDAVNDCRKVDVSIPAMTENYQKIFHCRTLTRQSFRKNIKC